MNVKVYVNTYIDALFLLCGELLPDLHCLIPGLESA